MQVAIDKSDGLGRIEASEYALSENDIRNVKRAQARVSKRNYNGAKIDNASDFNEDNKKESLWSLIKGGLVKLLANICLIVGAFCKLIITFFVLIIKALLRITFPVAVALSFIYGAEKTIGADRIFTFDSPSLGSEDFSCLFPEYAPGAQFRLGSGNSDPNTRHGIHNSKNTFDEDCIAAGTAVLVQFVRDYLN